MNPVNRQKKTPGIFHSQLSEISRAKHQMVPDGTRCQDLDVEILADLPSTLVAQARLFASKGLVLAPNGGWAPNVIFMPFDAWQTGKRRGNAGTENGTENGDITGKYMEIQFLGCMG